MAGGAKPAGALAEALAHALAQAEKSWPRGSIHAAVASDIARERAEAELRSAAGRAVAIHGSDSTAWTVILEEGPEQRPAPLHRRFWFFGAAGDRIGTALDGEQITNTRSRTQLALKIYIINI